MGSGSKSQLFTGKASMILETSSGWQMSNEFILQSVRVKAGGGELAVAEQIASTIELLNENYLGGLKNVVESVFDDAPKTRCTEVSSSRTFVQYSCISMQCVFSLVLRK